LQVSGFYLDIDLGEPVAHRNQIEEKINELKGESPNFAFDGRYCIVEMHTELDLEGYEDKQDGEMTGVALPYVVTMELGTAKVLSIYRNWYEDDENKKRRQHFVHYEYIPGLGFYGFGLINLIGGMTKSATSTLRMLHDAGTLSNLPGGLKTRGLRIQGDDSPIAPGSWKDVDVPGGNIRDNILPLPYKEPSSILFQLMQNMVEEARRFASLSNLKASEMNNEAPVGTTLAIIERTMKIMSAIQARLHASMKREFQILTAVIRDNAPHEYPYDISGDEKMLGQDFDDRVDVIPVSDPNASTMALRILQGQAVMQLMAMKPDIYDDKYVHRRMLTGMGIEDAEEIVPTDDEVHPYDPVTENMHILMGKPVKAKIWEDHESHIMVHMMASEDPKMQQLMQQNPQAPAIAAAGASHVTEHVAYAYRAQIEKELGIELPNPEDPLPEPVVHKMSKMLAEAASRVLKRNTEETRQGEAQKNAEDPIIQMRERELKLKEMETVAGIKDDEKSRELDQMKIEADVATKIIDGMLGKDTSEKKIQSDQLNKAGDATVSIIQQLLKARIDTGGSE
jgi:hypothetical protein